MGSKVLDEAVVCDSTGLLESGHAFLDFNVDLVIVDECLEVILCDDFIRDDVYGKAHVLEVRKGRAVVEFFYVDATEAAIWCRDGAVEQELDGCDGGKGGRSFT